MGKKKKFGGNTAADGIDKTPKRNRLKMLKELRIREFQRHEKRRVKFCAGVTTFIGPTDSGKSALIRALRWVCRNTPAGLAHLRHGASEVSAELFFDEGRRVKRIRSKKENRYFLDDQEFASFNNDVPAPIQQALAIGDHNFQGQHDSPYWLAAGAGQVSRELNQIIDLEIVDHVAATLNAKTRAALATVEVVEKRHQAAKSDLNALAGVPQMREDFEDLGEYQETAKTTSDNLAKLNSILGVTEEKIEWLSGISDKLKAMEVVFQAAETHAAKSVKSLTYSIMLGHLRESYKASRIEIPQTITLEIAKNYAHQFREKSKTLNELVAALGKLQKSTEVEIPTEVEIDILFDYDTARRASKEKLIRFLEQKADVAEASLTLKRLSAELEAAEKELSETPGICPTCQQPLRF